MFTGIFGKFEKKLEFFLGNLVTTTTTSVLEKKLDRVETGQESKL